MSTLWLHCGAHKTATTSLQQVLSRLQPELHRLGCCYIPPKTINQSSLVADLHAAPDDDDRRRIQRVRQFFAPVVALNENVLISHESLLSYAYASPDPRRAMQFYGTVPNALSRLQQAEVFHRVVLILYIRRQDHYLESIYFEELKQGSNFPSFEDYLDFRKPEEVSWLKLVETFERYLPSDDIVLRPFESIVGRADSFLRDFLEIFGWPKEWEAPSLPKLNARPSEFALRLYLSFASRLKPDLRGWLAMRLFRIFTGHGLRPARPANDEQRRRLLVHHIEGNRSVFSKMTENFQPLLANYEASLEDDSSTPSTK